LNFAENMLRFLGAAGYGGNGKISQTGINPQSA
jgi:hypothetical protein